MTTLSAPNWKRKLMGAMAVLLASATIASACSKNAPQATEPAPATPPAASTGESGQPPAGEAQTPPSEQAPNGQVPSGGSAPGGPTGQPAEPVKLAPLELSNMYKKTVLDLAKAQGLKTVYVPKQGAQDDRVSQIQGMGDAFTIQYLNMELTQSAKELKPSGKAEAEKPAQLKIGSGKLVTEDGKPALYLKVEETYVALRSLQKLSASDLESIAESLEPLK
ncbi:superantigen-like protein SSL4 [Paenibacillus puerhi]|uniref:hypothetical protein n=1 Tax=Paenibacillus puerhi TaxID=2692622 RepID=UPI00135C7E36|nr:hypothetical protein [Paenibacillus puerhi]